MAASNGKRKILEGPTEIEYGYSLLKILLQNTILKNPNHTSKDFSILNVCTLYLKKDAYY